MLDKTHTEVLAIKLSADDALQLATRNALLNLRDTLLSSFNQEVMQRVNIELENKEFIAQVILEIK